jgi:hypothetical protein
MPAAGQDNVTQHHASACAAQRHDKRIADTDKRTVPPLNVPIPYATMLP